MWTRVLYVLSGTPMIVCGGLFNKQEWWVMQVGMVLARATAGHCQEEESGTSVEEEPRVVERECHELTSGKP